MNKNENISFMKIQEILSGIIEILKSNHRIDISTDLVTTENEKQKKNYSNINIKKISIIIITTTITINMGKVQ